MALNVGRLVAELELDDAQFQRGVQSAEQRLRQLDASAQQMGRSTADAGRVAGRGLEQVGGSAQQAGRQIGQVGDQAQQASRGVGRLETSADQAARATRRIEIPSGLASAAQRASDAIGKIGQNAAGAASSGSRLGDNFVSGFSDKLGNLSAKSGPVAGSLIGLAALGVAAGAALAGAIISGMKSELDRDIFQAQTGVTEAQARKFGLASGESYADAFGESINGNLQTVKNALQTGLLDPAATQRDAETMINSLDGVATIMGEEIPDVARAAGQALKTGFATSAQDAFDLFVKASQMGLNVSQDFLDTVTEYGTQFRKVGLTGAEAIGLMSQAVKAGARDTDLAADAIKEFTIRVVDGSESSAGAFDALGLNAQEMTAKFAQGGSAARGAMGEVFTAMRNLKDPVEKNTVALALFGTQAEDLGGALGALNLDEAARSMDGYSGAAKRAIDIMGNNAATSVDGAMRSISVAGDQIKAALAEAFGPHIQKFANFISNNREEVIGFFITLGNAAFDVGKALLQFTSGALKGFAFVAEAGANMASSVLEALSRMVAGFESASGLLEVFGIKSPIDGLSDKLHNAAKGIHEFGENTAVAANKGAEFIDNTLIPALDRTKDKFQHMAADVKLSAAFNDQITKVNASISSIGMNIDGTTMKIENWTGAIDRANPAQVKMEESLKSMVGAFEAQNRTGLEAGATVEELTAQYGANREALVAQLAATLGSKDAAEAYLMTLGLVPNLVATQISQPGMPEAHYAMDVLLGKVKEVPNEKTIVTQALTKDALDELIRLGLKVENLPNGDVKVTPETAEAERLMQEFLARKRVADLTVVFRDTAGTPIDPSQLSAQSNPGAYSQNRTSIPNRADGSIDANYASGKLPDQAIIQPARGRGLVNWAEDETEGEAFIPMAGSKRKRSLDIWAQVGKRFGILKMADGGITDADIARMGGGTVNKSLWAAVKSHNPSAVLTSAKTDHDADGGYHPKGMAIDVDPSQANADYLWSIRSQLGQIITTIPDRVWYNVNGEGWSGQQAWNTYGDSTMQQHSNHIHTMALAEIANTGAATTTGPKGPRTDKQKIVDRIVAEGRRRGKSDAEIAAAISAGLVESDLTEGKNGQDHDSVNVYQQRPSQGWGGADESVETDTGQFFDALDKTDPTKPLAERVADVQKPREDLRGKYADRMAEANQLLAESVSGSSGASTSSTLSSSSTSSLSSGGGIVPVEVTNWPTDAGDNNPRTPRAVLNAKLFANGGVNESMIGAPGDVRIWNEKPGHGEGYVSFDPSIRSRSLAVWAEIGRRIGVPGFADGGVGFGGYTPDTSDSMAPKNWYDALALGTGLGFTALSGLSGIVSMAQSGTVDLGNIIPSFDTSSNSIPGLSEAFTELVKPLEEILETLKKGGMIKADIDVDTNTGAVNANLQRVGMA